MTTQEVEDEPMQQDRDEVEAAESVETPAEPTEPTERRPTRRERLWSGRSRRTRIVSAVLAAVLLIGAAGTGWLATGRSVFGVHSGEGVLSFLPAWLADGVAFRYDDRAVTVDELERHVDMLRALYGVKPPSGGKQMDAFRKDTAKSYAVSLILDDAAGERGIEIADKQARDALSRFVSERLGPGPDAYSQFIGTLADAGTSEEVVLDELKRRLAMARLFDRVAGERREPTAQEVRTAFENRKDELATPEKRRISNIVVETKDDARQVRQEIRDGASFAAVAKRSSLDGSTRDKGGDLGKLPADQLEPEYAEAAFNAADGELFGPVQTRPGWNVGQVREIISGERAKFGDVKDELKKQLQAEAALGAWRSWLGMRIADADVRYADTYRPADPDAPPETAPTDGAPPR